MTSYEQTEEARNRRRRREDALRRLGTREPRCSRCLESDPAALTGVHPNIVCHECSGNLVEGDHFEGKANSDLVFRLLGNDHRVRSDLQLDWPVGTLRNPDGSPLLRAAAAIQSWLDFLWIIITRAVGWIPPALEWLDRLLREQVGPEWWKSIGWEPVA
ncbi:MAG: hypothetical protein Q8Q52_01635 [Acidimicrobiia bacterium]|nr:hypothetical protein [Acidimicrobiia bacterium]